MARFNVTAPDGSIIPVDAPAGATEQDAIAFAASTFKPAQAPAAPVQSEIPSARRPSFSTGLARSAASLADVTVGSAIPGAVQFFGYPFARVGRSPQEAQAATKRIAAPFEQPFGRTFGVADTPEYQQEASRQFMDYVGQSFQDFTKSISGKTGLSQPDVENMIGSLTLAVPKVIPPVARAVSDAAAPVIQDIKTGVQLPFEPRLQARRERRSAEDYARGPQIDAAADAQRLGIALDPIDIEPSRMAKITSMAAGPRGPEALANVNKNQVRTIALKEMDLPLTTQLNGKDAFNQARAKVAGPYDQVAKLPTMTADDASRAALDRLRPDASLIGSDKYAKAMNDIIDDAVAKVDGGLTGADLLKNVQVLRQRARKTYNNKNADLAALDVADTNLAVANALESMIETNIFNPKLLDQFRTARQKMARSYAYEGATDMNTGILDVKKLSRITAKDNTLTGDIAALGKVAGNFPDVFSAAPTPGILSLPRLSRSGPGGAAGALIGSQFGLTGSILGGALGGLGTEMIGAAAARRMASPSYQAGLNLRDARIPVNQLAASMQPIPQDRALVPYQAPVEVLMPGEGPYQPNFVMQPNQYGPRVTTPGFAPGPAQLPAPSAQGTLNMLRSEDVRRGQMSRTLGQQAEAQQAAAEAAARRPTSGAVEMQINPLTGLPEIATGIKGATPATFQDFGTSLKSATDKAAAGRMFDLTAAEKVAFDKTRVDLAEVVPGMKTLTDKAIAAKIQDRAWVQDAIGKAQDRARAFEAIAARADTERARQSALANRERMLDIVADLEEGLRAPRPDTSSKLQGPKTRAAKRNALISDNQNALAP